MRTIATALTASLLLAGCGGGEPGPAARAFNKERQAIDARNAAALRTRMVAPPKSTNGGYAALPSAIDARGERPDAAEGPGEDGAAPSAATVPASKGYLVQPGSKEPPPLDPEREAALRRVPAARMAQIRKDIAAAEARRKATIAAQAKTARTERSGRVADIRKTDARAAKAYRPPARVSPAPSKGVAPGRPASTVQPSPRATGTPTRR